MTVPTAKVGPAFPGSAVPYPGSPPPQTRSRQRTTSTGGPDGTDPRHLPAAGPLGAAGLTAGPGHGDLRHRVGLGRRTGRGPQAVRPLRRPRWQPPRHRRHLHRRELRAPAGRVRPRGARPPGAGDQVLDAAPPRRPQLRGRPPQGPVRLGGGEPAAAGHRLPRSAVPARLGLPDAGRGGPARPGRPGPAGQGAVRGDLQHPGLAGVPDAGDRRPARLVAAGRRWSRCSSSTA